MKNQSGTNNYTVEDEIADEVRLERIAKGQSWHWPPVYKIASGFDPEAIRPIVNRKIRFYRKMSEEIDELAYLFPEFSDLLFEMRRGSDAKLEWFLKLKSAIAVKDGKLDVEKARNTPILSVYSFSKLRRYKDKTFVACPFHEDKTPSMIINKNNTFKCFSCQRFGDTIAFVSELYGKDFINSVNFINGV